MSDYTACFIGLIAFAVVGRVLWLALIHMEQNSPEPHDQIKGGFLQESRLYKGPRGIMAAAALAESHRSGRERWRAGRVILTDKDIDEYTVHHAQWLVDNTHDFPEWGIRVDNRLSDSPREVYKRLFDEAHSNFREIPKYPPDERGYPIKIDKHERTRR
jgi:hypothetical protein